MDISVKESTRWNSRNTGVTKLIGILVNVTGKTKEYIRTFFPLIVGVFTIPKIIKIYPRFSPLLLLFFSVHASQYIYSNTLTTLTNPYTSHTVSRSYFNNNLDSFGTPVSIQENWKECIKTKVGVLIAMSTFFSKVFLMDIY